MKPEDQRIAIAEWCGWKLIDVVDGTKFSNPEEPLIVQRWVNKDLGLLSRKLPDYLNDLNAMHEAEKKVEPKESYKAGEALTRWLGYREHLFTICEREHTPALHATAAQRAEALLRTIGRWTDSTLHTKG